MTTKVLIVGAGPTGLMLANQLNRFNIEFIIIDKKNGPTQQSRALAITPRSMELYQQLELSDKIMEQSNRLTGLNLYSEGNLKADIVLSEIGKYYTDFVNPMLIFEQSKNEELLCENLYKHERNILWNYEFISIDENGKQPLVTVANISTNNRFQITANCIVGCDGARSPVRHAQNFKFEGGTYENKFYVVDTDIDWKFGKNKVIIVPSDEVFVAFFPMKGEKQYRIIGTLPKKFNEKNEIDFKDLELTIKNATKFDLKLVNIGWHSIYKLHHRCVDTFSKGKIFLAGDAAHVHSPAGGQGMNTGLQDAHNLSWKLALVIKGEAKISLLETYNEERLPFARFLLKFTDRAFSFMAGGNWFLRKFRKHVMLSLIGRAMKFNKIRLIAFKTLSQLFYSYSSSTISFCHTKQKIKFKAGDRIPWIEEHFLKKFKEPVFHLLHISDTVFPDNKLEELKANFPFSIKLIENQISSAWRNLGVISELFLLIRPDHHILFITDKLDKQEIELHLRTHFNC